jgi:tellurite resistance protein TehA-like permease
MKKIIITIGLVGITNIANAQMANSINMNQDEMFKVIATIILFAMLAFVILKVVKYFMDYYLKNKIIDK